MLSVGIWTEAMFSSLENHTSLLQNQTTPQTRRTTGSRFPPTYTTTTISAIYADPRSGRFNPIWMHPHDTRPIRGPKEWVSCDDGRAEKIQWTQSITARVDCPEAILVEAESETRAIQFLGSSNIFRILETTILLHREVKWGQWALVNKKQKEKNSGRLRYKSRIEKCYAGIVTIKEGPTETWPWLWCGKQSLILGHPVGSDIPSYPGI